MNTLIKKYIKSNFLSLIIRNVITGKEFNKKYNDTKLYKIVKDNFIHNNFKYKHGLNIDILPFNPTGECLHGGLYFAELNKLILWFSHGSYICKVIIPDDASVNIEKNKFKNWCFKNNISLIQACLHFVKQFKKIDYLVVGFNNYSQLREIIDVFKKKHIIVPRKFSTNKIDLIDPRKWNFK